MCNKWPSLQKGVSMPGQCQEYGIYGMQGWVSHMGIYLVIQQDGCLGFRSEKLLATEY